MTNCMDFETFKLLVEGGANYFGDVEDEYVLLNICYLDEHPQKYKFLEYFIEECHDAIDPTFLENELEDIDDQKVIDIFRRNTETLLFKNRNYFNPKNLEI